MSSSCTSGTRCTAPQSSPEARPTGGHRLIWPNCPQSNRRCLLHCTLTSNSAAVCLLRQPTCCHGTSEQVTCSSVVDFGANFLLRAWQILVPQNKTLKYSWPKSFLRAKEKQLVPKQTFSLYTPICYSTVSGAKKYLNYLSSLHNKNREQYEKNNRKKASTTFCLFFLVSKRSDWWRKNTKLETIHKNIQASSYFSERTCTVIPDPALGRASQQISL